MDLSSRPFYKVNDYERFIIHEIKRMGLAMNIHFCGNLNATHLVDEILNADVFVNPSFVESYSATAAEALYLGAPTVLAYAGAMVNFSQDATVALYYNCMDYRSLAAKVMSLLENNDLRNEIISNARMVLENRCSPLAVKARQLEIYSNVKALFKTV